MKEKHKLSPPWEGPYMVTEVIRLGAYRLKDDNGNVLTNTWNGEQLRRFPLNLVLPLLFNTCSCKAPQPKHFQPGLLGGSMRAQILNTTSFFYYHMVKTFSPNESAFYSFDYPM